MTAGRMRQALKAATALLPFAVIAVLWQLVLVGGYRSPHEVARLLNAVADQPLGWALVPLGVAAAVSLFVPVTALIAGVTLSFEPVPGFVFALGGAVLGACATYGLGRLLGGTLLEVFAGPRVKQVVGLLQRHAFRSVAALRLSPVGGFTLISLVAGSLRLPFVRFVAGTAVGLLPGVILFTVLGSELPVAWRVALLAAGLLALVTLVISVRRWLKGQLAGAAPG